MNSSSIFNVVGDPIVQTCLLAGTGALITRVLLRGHPTRILIGQVAFFVALTALLLYHGIIPFQPGPANVSTVRHVLIGIVKAIWWISTAWSLISIVRLFLILDRQPRESRLLQDLVVGVIYVGAVLSVIAYVFNAPVGTLIATSGALAIILGLALQSTLSDVFSGIALNLAKPYGIGDWLMLADGVEGRVVETNWRATHLLTGANDLVIVPHSILAKARVTNFTSPDQSHGVTLNVRFLPAAAPSAMIEVMQSVLLSSNSILSTPEPSVYVTSLGGDAVELQLAFRVADVNLAARAKSEIFDLTYRHAKAVGLILAPPAESGVAVTDLSQTVENKFGHHTTPRRLIDAISLFASMNDEEKEALSSTMTRRTFRKGDLIAEQGQVLTSLMILRSGIVAVVRRDETRDGELVRLAPGDFFGEGGLLTGAGELGRIEALTFVVVYEVTQQALATLMRDRPAIAEELGTILSRRKAEFLKHENMHGAIAIRSVSLAARIRQLFNLNS